MPDAPQTSSSDKRHPLAIAFASRRRAARDRNGDQAQLRDAAVLAVGEQADAQKAAVGASSASTKKEEPVLARFSLTPSAPLDEQRQRPSSRRQGDRFARRSGSR